MTLFANLNIPPAGESLTDKLEEDLKPKFDEHGNPVTKTLRGIFEYIDRDEGWGDSFRVVDTDGMPFALDACRAFHGRGVRITIEYDEQAAEID